jgi:mannose-1-phosphate guanylyltransferase
MIRQTFQRLEGEVPPERILVVTVRDQADTTRERVPELPKENVIIEPEPRNTAAAVGLGAVHVEKRAPDSTMLVVTADHVIRPKEAFWRHVLVAQRLANDGVSLVIFGIKPTWGNPGFGYIWRGQPVGEFEGIRCFHARKFEEKPCPATAQKWVETGEYYWNSGMFVWKTATILRELERCAPEIYAPISRIRKAIGSPSEQAVTSETYRQIPKRPIDKAVMEKAADVKVVEATFEWDDVGSWKSLSSHHLQDKDGNTVLANHRGIRTSGCIIAGDPKHLIATIGISDLVIVQTPDATLVCHKNEVEDIKKIVEALEKDGLEDYL